MTRHLLLAAFLVAGTLLFAPSSAKAGYPPYLLLRTPPSGPRQLSQGYQRGWGEGVSAPTYSYGYFGVPPRDHVSRHHGYYRNYTEWSRR